MSELKKNLDAESLSRVRAHSGVGQIGFTRLINQEKDGSAFLFVDYCEIPSSSSIGLHSHSDIEEIYVLLAGKAIMRLMGEEFEVGTGDLVRIPVGAEHELWNSNREDVLLMVIAVKKADQGEN